MLNFLKKTALLTATTTMVLGIASVTNFNATLIVEAAGENEDSPQASNPSENADSEEITDLVKENLQTTIEQIESDELYQKFAQLFDLIEQAEALQDSDQEDIDNIKDQIHAVVAEIGGGHNESLTDRGEYHYLSDLELDELIASIKTIAHYQEYYELATLVQTAHKVSCSNEFSADHIARLVESTTDVALSVEIPVKNDYTANSSNNSETSTPNQSQTATTNTWVQVALSNQGRRQASSTTQNSTKQDTADSQSSTSTVTNTMNSIVDRPSASHADSDGLTNYNTSLADALAHTSTVCIAIGTVVIGGLSVRRQQKTDNSKD